MLIEKMMGDIRLQKALNIATNEFIDAEYSIYKIGKIVNIHLFFPIFEIENHVGRKETIEELHLQIKVFFSDDGDCYRVSKAISGTRTKLSLRHYLSNYLHSHLNTSIGRWVAVCTGTDIYEELDSAIYISKNMKKEDHKSYDKLIHDLINIILYIPVFIVSEYTSGNPYKKLSSIENVNILDNIDRTNLSSFDYAAFKIEDHPDIEKEIENLLLSGDILFNDLSSGFSLSDYSKLPAVKNVYIFNNKYIYLNELDFNENEELVFDVNISNVPNFTVDFKDRQYKLRVEETNKLRIHKNELIPLKVTFTTINLYLIKKYIENHDTIKASYSAA